MVRYPSFDEAVELGTHTADPSSRVAKYPTAVRIVIETVFAAAAAALAPVGRTRLALAFGIVAAMTEVLNYTLDY